MRFWGTKNNSGWKRIPLCSAVGLPEVVPVVVLVQRDVEKNVLLLDLFQVRDLVQQDVEKIVLLLDLFQVEDLAQQDVEEVVLLLVQVGVLVQQDVEEIVPLVDQVGVLLLHQHAEETAPPNSYFPSQCCYPSAVEEMCRSYFLRIWFQRFDVDFFLLSPSMTLFNIQASGPLALIGV